MNSCAKLKNKFPLLSAAKPLRSASFLILSSILLGTFNSSIWAMEETAEMKKASGSVRGKPETYKTEVTSGQWTRVVDDISKQFRMITRNQVVKGLRDKGTELDEGQNVQLDSIINGQVQKWQKTAGSFFKSYKNLSTKLNRQKLITRESFFGPLFDFVVEFETIYDTLSQEYRKLDFQDVSLEVNFLVFQTAWNGYMKYYPLVEKKDLFSSVLLGFSKEHLHKKDDGKDYLTLKHLACLWNSKGILLFTIFPHEQIEGNLYSTYLPYGRQNLDSFEERRVFFYDIGGIPTIVENSGYYIHQNEDYVAAVHYTGKEEPKPYCLRAGICLPPEEKIQVFSNAVELDERDEEDIPIIRNNPKLLVYDKDNIRHNVIVPDKEDLDQSIRQILPSELETGGIKMKRVGEREHSIARHAHTFFSSLLQDAPKSFIMIPKSLVEHLETYYTFLLELRERQAKCHENPDISYAIACVQNVFPGKTLEEAILQVENELEEASVDLEKEKIREEQEQCRQKVCNDQPDPSSKKQSHKRGKGRKEKHLSFSRKKEAEVIKDEGKDQIRIEDARNNAKKRIDLLKNSDFRKSMKYSKYLKLVNVAVQGLREAGVPVEMALNAGSHGFLSIGDQTLPLCRPHGGRDTITASSAKGTLDTLLDAYFGTLGGKKEDNSKSE